MKIRGINSQRSPRRSWKGAAVWKRWLDQSPGDDLDDFPIGATARPLEESRSKEEWQAFLNDTPDDDWESVSHAFVPKEPLRLALKMVRREASSGCPKFPAASNNSAAFTVNLNLDSGRRYLRLETEDKKDVATKCGQLVAA